MLVNEIAALYESYSRHEPSPLSEPAIQYADYAVWQREWLQDNVLRGQLDYWKDQLKDAPVVLNMPTDRPRPPAQTYKGASQSITLSPKISTALKDLSQSEGATLFMTLLAVFDVLLYRYSGQSDILVGTPIAGRNRSETESLIGFFTNTLVMRADMSGVSELQATAAESERNLAPGVRQSGRSV